MFAHVLDPSRPQYSQFGITNERQFARPFVHFFQKLPIGHFFGGEVGLATGIAALVLQRLK